MTQSMALLIQVDPVCYNVLIKQNDVFCKHHLTQLTQSTMCPEHIPPCQA